jgi:hypothetical protein
VYVRGVPFFFMATIVDGLGDKEELCYSYGGGWVDAGIAAALVCHERSATQASSSAPPLGNVSINRPPLPPHASLSC